MKKNYPLLILFFLFIEILKLHAQVFKLHAEYKTDWYGSGYTMNEDIIGYPSISLLADSAADQFVIEADNGFNRWRKYGTTAFDTAFPSVWYTLIITDNYFSNPTTPGYYYTTRLKNVGYSSTNFIVMQTERKPVGFAASNPVSQSPLSNAVADLQAVDVIVNLDTIPSAQEKFFVRYTTDNFATSTLVPLLFSIPNSTVGIATIPGLPAGTKVSYYVFSTTVNAINGTLANDYDLITLKQSTNQGANFSYTVAPVLSKVIFKVNMSNETVSPNGVYLTGSFNNFDTLSTPMTDIGNGIYQASVMLDTGSVVAYKFLNGSSFLTEEQVPASCGVSNGFGGFNRIITVPAVDTELDTICFSSCSNCLVATPVDIEFLVNMSQQTISPDGVHIAGTFNGFDPGANLMTSLGNGIYSAIISTTSGSILDYKFINGKTFLEEENVPASCGVSNGFGAYNRSVTVPSQNMTLNPVCFSACVNCIPPVSIQVTFRVNMSNEIVSPNGVHVAGNFNGFTADSTLMNPIGANIYEAIVTVNNGSLVSYKFINGDTFSDVENVSSACGVPDGFGGYNRSFIAPAINDTVLSTVCFSSCVNCALPVFVDVVFRVNMSNEVVSPNGVYIAGTFNGFSANSTVMTAIGGGIYAVQLSFDTSSAVSYKFINGNSFAGVENVPSGCGIQDGFGGFNRYIDVPNVSDTLDLVCFSSCSNCVVAPVLRDITFRVDLTGLSISPNGVHIAGDFNSFSASATSMNLIGNNVYAATISLDTTTTVHWKYINGNAYGVGLDETVPSACGAPNGFGGFNRVINVPNANDTLPLVCFSSCSACLGNGIQDLMPTENDFILAPTVTAENSKLIYYKKDLSKLMLSIFAADGSLVKSVNLEANVGRNELELNTSSLNPGVYLIQLSSAYFSKSKKLIRIK